MKTVNIGGPVNYVDLGGPADAPQVVYVHGLGGCHLNWMTLAPLLSEHVRAVAVDLPGFGLTPATGRRTTVKANAEVLRQFLHTVVGGPSILVGNSMGGLVSTMVASTSPDLVSRLVLIDPTLPLVGRLDIEPAVRRSFFLQGLPFIGERFLAKRFAEVPARQRMTEVMGRCCADPTRVSPEMLDAMIALEETLTAQKDHAAAYLGAARSIVRGLARPSGYWRRLGSLTQPVLLLHGIHDRLIPIASARAAAKRLPHWTYVELNAGHIPMMETPAPVAAEILNWLR